MDKILAVENLRKHYVKKSFFGGASPAVKAVDGVSFSIDAGKVFVLAGESGSGKSTVARLILGAEEADGGSVFFDGECIDYSSRGSTDKIRAHCQMVHQNPYDSINPRMHIGDIVMEPLQIRRWGADKKERIGRMRHVLREVKLEPVEEVVSMLPHQISGGQRQRVVLARALALKPKLIIADEPVSMLDVSIRAEVLNMMEDLRENSKIAFLYITHDLATAKYFGDDIAIMYKGRIVECGPLHKVLEDPKHPYTQALIDAVSDPDPKNIDRDKAVRINDVQGKDVTGCAFRKRCPYAIEQCASEPKLSDAGADRKVACFVPIESSD